MQSSGFRCDRPAFESPHRAFLGLVLAAIPVTLSPILYIMNRFLMRLITAFIILGLIAAPASASPHEPLGEQSFLSPQSNPIALSPDDRHVYVANTTSGTVDVIDTATRQVIARVSVGLEPVSVAVRPELSDHAARSQRVCRPKRTVATLRQILSSTSMVSRGGVSPERNASETSALSARNLSTLNDRIRSPRFGGYGTR